MRFRRRNFRRAPREPRHWTRVALGTEFKWRITDVNANFLILFDPDDINVTSDESYTPMRIIVDKMPTCKVGAITGEFVSANAMVQLDWLVCKTTSALLSTNAVPAPGFFMKDAIFQNQTDVILGGSLQFNVFSALSEVGGWYSTSGGPRNGAWLDFNPRRRVNTGEHIVLFAAATVHANAAGGVPFVPADTNTCISLDPATGIEVLYQRTMRKR